MVQKVLEILGSPRFWLITATAVVAVLNGADFQVTLQAWTAAVVGIGTVEKVAAKIGGK